MNSLVCFPEGAPFTSVKGALIETKSNDVVKEELSSSDQDVHVLCVLRCVPVTQNTNSFCPATYLQVFIHVFTSIKRKVNVCVMGQGRELGKI